MSSVDLGDPSSLSGLRGKRGHRKGWIVKAEKHRDTLRKVTLEELNQANLKRFMDNLATQKEEYVYIQSHLISQMESREDVEEPATNKEREDLEDNVERFGSLLDDFAELNDFKSLMNDIQELLRRSDKRLDNLQAEKEFSHSDVQSALKVAELQLEELRAKEAKLPESFCLIITEKIATLEHRLRDIQTRGRADRPPVPVATSSFSSTPISAAFMRTRLPDIAFPKFHGDKLQWPLFWEGFTTLLDRDTRLTEADKLAYLRMSVKTTEAESEFLELTGAPGDFEIITKRLENLYLDPRLTYKTQVKDLVNGKATDRAGALEWHRVAVRARRILKQSGQYDGDHILSVLLEMKMTGKLREDWIKTAGSNKKIPALDEVLKFLERIGQEQQRMGEDKPKTVPVPYSPAKPKKVPVLYTQSEPAASSALAPPPKPKPPCKLCNVERHPMFFCPTFKSMAVQQRKEVVQRLKLCSNCLGYAHTPQQCRSTRTCRECHQRHHTALHDGHTQRSPTTSPPSATVTQPITYLANADPSGGILPTAIVTIEANGTFVQARAILDTCSTASYISSRLVQQLRATTIPGSSSATGVGQVPGLKCNTRTQVTIHPKRLDQQPPFLIEAYVTTSVAMVLPMAPLTGVRELPFLQGLDLADPSFDSPGRIDLLLGLQATARMGTVGIVENRSSQDRRYYAISTIYGWTVRGWYEEDHRQAAVYMSVNKPPDNLREFWVTEECQDHDKSLSKDDNLAISHFTENVSRDEDGRYVVRLPRKIPTPELGHSRIQAEKRFDQNQRSLKRKGQWEPFCTAVQEYGQLHHAERVPTADLARADTDCYYLPMHGVTKESSTSTKLRVVFDASARTSNGVSLNDTLLPGPNQYPLITDILLKFRRHNIGMTADISKMFREVGLHAKDRDLHRFLWKTEEQTVQIWRMTRVTFGVTSSPFLATQTLRQLASDYETDHPLAAATVRQEFYVDDCLTGADTVEQAITLRTSLNELLEKAGMNLRKWRTSSEDLQTSIPSELCEEEAERTLLSPEKCHKTLGIHWDITSDEMYISTPELETNRVATKRQVSSDLARTYDVLGWFSPAMVIAKLVIQELWIMGLNWDVKVPDKIAESWTRWTEELPLLTRHPIRRCYYNKFKERLSVQLHGFADASEKAYGGVVYLRTFYADATTTIALVISKTKVAPIKTLTIPKLELCGAVLLSKLLCDAQKILEISSDQTFAWTDSTIVLGWLNHNPGRLKVFVANRVIAITNQIPADRWRHVPTDSNPADAASRGLMPSELVVHDLWWDGPPWLGNDPGHWPHHPQQKKVTLPEVKTDIVLLTTLEVEPLNLAENYSTLSKLLRTTAWLRRFAHNARQKEPSDRRMEARLTTEELTAAELFLVKGVQQKYYSTELSTLSKQVELSTKSSIRNLYPLLDKDGVLRVGGRLEGSNLPFTSKHPMILPRQARLTHLIVQNLHTTNHHVGASTLMGLLAERYFVIGARAAVRSLTRRCITCRKAHSKNAQQLMGQLPSYRTVISPVFSHVGTDFAGPIIVKSGNPRKPRKTKCFICLFVCMATKAVHVEVVTDLTTSAFMAALHRFTSRRGLPQVIYSDNGTNFMGAGHELEDAYKLLQEQDSVDQIQRQLADSRIKWSHTPSRAPHFGGLWESNIKSIKTLLRKTICQATLTYEELFTVLCQVEATLNSRPLVPLNTQPTDGTLALTPGHFLVGRPLRSLPDLQAARPGTPYRRWNLCQQLTKQFWDEWSKSYLSSLNHLNKWIRPQRSIRIGDIVLIKDLDLFTNVWPLGLVTDVHPGADGHVRAATVKSQKGSYKRPIVKLTLLIPEEEQTSSLAPEDGHA